MELAILGAVGLLGYTISEPDARASTSKDQPVPRHRHAYPWGAGTEVQRLADADRQTTQARWEQSRQPQLTGVVGPNTKPGGQLPYFGSARKQHTNAAFKQRRMELFTGATDMNTSETGTYQKKNAVPAMFKPEWTAGMVNSSGRTLGTPYGADQSARFLPSQIQNNVLPAQQVKVGKGLGVGPEVSAADGFHPMLRVMPKNINEHRINNLPGSVVHGASAVAAGPAEVHLAQFGPPRFWEQERRPTAPTKASVNAASERPFQPMGACGGRLAGGDYFGTAGHSGTYAAHTQPSRNRGDNNPGVHETNLTAAVHGMGAFAKATHDPSRFVSQQREQFQRYDGMLTGTTAPSANQPYLLPQTNRSLHLTDVVGNPGSAVEGGRARPQDPVGRTLREQTHPQSQPGVAAPYLKGHSVQATDKWLDRESKRYGQHVVGWMPAPHMATDVRVPGLVQLKPRLQLEERPSLPTSTTPLGMAPVGRSTGTYNKLPPTNTRLDLSIAQNQLAGNPLHLSVTPAQTRSHQG